MSGSTNPREASGLDPEAVHNVLKAEYEYEFDADFEKNRHYYPLIIQYGLDGLDASEIRERLDAMSLVSSRCN